jgi:hypothetical protein
VDWSTIVKSARAGFEKGANEWILRSRVKGGVIRGPNAELTPGSLSSDVNFERMIVQEITAAGAPAEVALILARELWSAWKEWADGFHMTLPGAFPKFAAFPGPQAPSTRAAQSGYALAKGTSSGDHRLQATTLQTRLATALRSVAGKESVALETELKSLAAWIDASFREWKASAQIMGLSGKGPVPTFAPPYVPVGPVVGSDAIAGDSVLAGPRFGRTGF